MAGLGLAIAAPAGAQAAQGGNRTEVEFSGTFVVRDLCDFPVTIDAQATGFVTEVDTRSGTLVRAHFNETDVFSANGVSLDAASYTFGIKVKYDEDGNVLSRFQTGVLVRVPLPNGETFLVAGRSDALQQIGDFVSTPTSGVTRNLDDFCAALSGEG